MMKSPRLLNTLTLTFLFFFSFFSLTNAQFDIDKLKGMQARAIGPAGMSGRVTTIDVVTQNPAIMYVGTASGGVWKSISGGVDWQPIFDKEAVASIGAIAIQQDNPDVIWVGTGEGNPRNSVSGGYGLYKSLDGGKNWQLVGLEKTRNIHRIVIDKKNPNTVYVGAIGSSWGEHPERGVFKTTDGGKTWRKVLFVNNKTGCADLVVDPINPNKLIAAMWEHRRKPWTFQSGGEGSGLYISYDGGEHWEKKTAEDGLPKGNLGRIGLAIAPSQPNIIYALIEAKKNALYKSSDGGFNWKKINDKPGIGNRPFYYSDLAVDPVNENRVYTIFTYVNVSVDGGKSFKQLMRAYGTSKGVHPDHHAWWIHPNNPNFMIDGNDGGLNITHDRGKTWRFVENLPIAQFYHINVDMDFPYNIYGGMQDNGSWVGPAYVLKAQGIRNAYWQELMFGDGFDVVPDPLNSRYGYAMSQQGYIGRYDRETGNAKMIRPTHPDPNIKLRFNWNSALAIDPFDKTTIYFGSQFVHKSTDRGFSWDIISPDLTTNDPEKLKQHESGGITMDATGAENHCTILAISPSAIEKGMFWAGTDDGQVNLSRDEGKTWANVTPSNKIMPEGSWVTQIKSSTFNAGEAYVVVNNYRNFDFKPYLFRTRDFGQTWESLVTEKDTPGYSLSLIQDPVEQNLIFLGTEYGLFVSIDEGEHWTKWTNGFPTVSTKDLTIHPREHDLIIGTFGRAAYVLDDIRPLRALAKKSTAILDKTIHLFEPPNAFITQRQQASGTRFGGNALFNGQNRASGAMISYIFNKPDSKEVEEDKEDKDKEETKKLVLKLEIFNAKGDLIRTLKPKLPKEAGLQRMYWSLTEKGVRRPSRNKPKKDAREPWGQRVLPGQYKLRLSYGEYVDSSTVDVKYDPRVDMPIQVLQNKYDLLKKLDTNLSLAEKATNQMIGSMEILAQYKKRLEENKTDNKLLLEENKAYQDSITQLMDLVLGKEDKRQGITRNKERSAIYYTYIAKSYVGELLQNPGKTERQLVVNADKKLAIVIDKINLFYKRAWSNFEASMKDINLSPFKTYNTLEKQ